MCFEEYARECLAAANVSFLWTRHVVDNNGNQSFVRQVYQKKSDVESREVALYLDFIRRY